MRLILIPAALLIAAAPAPAPQKHGDDVPAATPAGKPVDCLSLTQIRETRVRSDKVIDFVTNGGKIYRNELPMACPSLGFERRFLHKASNSEYCSLDTITVIQGGGGAMQGPTCGLGKFQPVTLDKDS